MNWSSTTASTASSTESYGNSSDGWYESRSVHVGPTDEDERRAVLTLKNKDQHRAFTSRRAGLPRMFSRWYR